MSTLSALCFCFVLITLNNAQDDPALLVNTNSGPVQGEAHIANLISGNAVNRWRGIRYAKAPVDELRFAAPQAAEPWSDASPPPVAVNACPQTCGFAGTPAAGLFCPYVTSEDCLFLNVYAPTDAEYGQTSYTTMIWIHGGKFDEGWATWFLYDPSDIVYNNDVIIVSINYRLGLLGNLYDREHGTGIDGNFGYLDQKLAIKWVYDNIEWFGGNPDNIVLFGESAGAQSVSLHLLYNDDGYINGGIMQSAPMNIELRNPATWYNVFDDFVNVVGCGDDLSDENALRDCLRDVPEATILAAQNNPAIDNSAWTNKIELWTPTVGTDLLAEQPVAGIWAQGQFKTPPFMIGLNHDEHFLFINDFEKETYGYNNLVNELSRYFGGKSDVVSDVLDYYDVSETSTGTQENYLYDEAGIKNDHWFCAAKKVLKETKNNYNIYYYSFDVIDPIQAGILWGAGTPQCVDRSCHVMELFYLFLPPLYQMYGMLLPNTYAIGGHMQKYWTNYAKSLNPNDEGEATWQMYSNQGNSKNEFLSMQQNQFVTEDFKPGRGDVCLFWNNIGYAGDY